ncbi:MAG: ubiquinone/menaquinone biosynthesis methyltransferase [Deltaproteobacteria bacterium]|nr:ubiquinone/menaquinone biosynthesis methyltransferase [Deltaproteobacteria bacterium]
MFSRVPQRYDLINRLTTWRMDEVWRARAVRECLRGDPKNILDICCGTGDLLLRLAKSAPEGVRLAGIDFSPGMLETARAKVASAGHDDRVSLLMGDIAELPFPRGYFDVVGISFAFRNLTYRNPRTDLYLAEIRRVLSPEGHFVIVESSQPSQRALRAAYHLYLRWVVAGLGGLISGSRGAYRYLSRSAAGYYAPDDLTDLLIEAGFDQVRYRSLFGGVAAIHVAR